LKILPVEEMGRILRLLGKLGLMTKIPGSYDRKKLVDLMISDKKAEDGKITIVLPARIGAVSIRKGIPPSLIESVLEELAA
jgi:3-dehydroquinate synthetase